MRRSLIVTGLKLTVFVVVSVLAGVMVVNTLTKPLPGRNTEYSGVFTDAAGLVTGADVLMGGVRVGRVDEVRIEDGRALVTFAVEDGQPVPADARLAIRYADLLGGRTLTVLPGAPGSPELAPGAVIPLERTQPAIDLTLLLNGFRPLFESIQPAQVNQLAGEIIGIFQGQGGTVADLLTHTVSLTQDLASRRQVLSGVLSNLNSLVDFTLTHRADFQQLIESLNTLVTGLAEDRGQLADAIDAGTALANTLSEAVDKVHPEIQPLLNSLTAATGTVTRNENALSDALSRAPALLANLDRTLDYGSWVNIYVCNLQLDTGLLGQVNLDGGPHSEVCR
ncbi:MCE family protein [Amycolatopsis acidicola]|uniref:MCE family protein n=1 Tax=Amycolatopsis acidicola TaxID=2596893 RepID=A0A5N0UQW8_9PSEU|nr:MlaD family protein [Amycolatopsis acidicola]KAA9151158.1 MCE family protein [Amycolatopsis acidicola]